jgi:DNA (cytosine-5)-methyltransferase 1
VWLYVPSNCSPEEGASLSDSSASAFARSVSWRGTLSLPRVWSRRWSEVPWLRLLSGATSAPSTADAGVDEWISSQGGFPCQDVSQAGKRAGVANGERSGLWREFARIVGEVGPRFVFVENVAALVVRGLDIVLGDLASLGFDAEWGCIRASDVGAPHRRERIFILAHARRSGIERRPGRGELSGPPPPPPPPPPPAREAPERERGGVGAGAGGEDGSRRMAHPKRHRLQEQREAGPASGTVERSGGAEVPGPGEQRSDDRCVLGDPYRGGLVRSGLEERAGLEGAQGSESLGSGQDGRLPWPPGPGDATGWREYLARWPGTEPALRRGADGLAGRVDRLRVLGNGVVPDQAEHAFRVLWEHLMNVRPSSPSTTPTET